MRFLTGILITIGLIVLVFVVILKSGGGPKQQPFNLNGYASTNAIAQLTIDGPIDADQQHQAVQVGVSSTGTTFEILHGYQGSVQTNKVFGNNQASFAVFLHALNLLGFSEGNRAQSLRDDRGYCPSGDRYVFELIDNGNDVFRYWATSCGGQGSFKGDVSDTLALFRAQVPNYDTLTENVTL